MRLALTIAVAQPPCVPYDIRANAQHHASMIRSAGARVVVFPELSLTGYELDATALSVEEALLAPIVQACGETGSAALVGAPLAGEAGQSHIAILAVTGDGVTAAYRKLWLGGAEPGRFSPGGGPSVLEVDGWRLGLAICKDTGIPGHAAATAALGMDVYAAAVLEAAEDAARIEVRARRVARDHGVWVAAASFAGSTGGGFERAAGGSGIWSPDGVLVAGAGPKPGRLARYTIT